MQQEPEGQETVSIGGREVPIQKGSLYDRMSQHPRITGVAMCAFGLWMTKVAIFDVLDAARQHAEEIHFSYKSLGAAAIFTALGLFLLIGGKMADRLMSRKDRTTGDTIRSTVLAVLCLVPLILLYIWFKGELQALGYSI